MKKKIAIISLLSLLVLGGCGSKKTGEAKPETKSKSGKVEVTEGYYFMPEGAEDGSEYLMLNLKVTNELSDSVYLYKDTFYLTEKGESEQIDSFQLDYDSDVKIIEGELSKGKTKASLIPFEIKEDTKYTLHTSLTGVEGKDTIEVALDPDDYDDTKKDMEEAAEAAQVFFDVAFYQKEDEKYDKLIGTDKKEMVESIKKEFANRVKDYYFYSYRPSDDEINKMFTEYVKQQGERGELKVELVSYYGDSAKVKVDFKGLSYETIYKDFSDIEREYNDNTGEYDSEKSEKYALEKYGEVFSQADIGEPRDEQFITMTKKDGKWLFDFKSNDHYENKRFIEVFNGYVN